MKKLNINKIAGIGYGLYAKGLDRIVAQCVQISDSAKKLAKLVRENATTRQKKKVLKELQKWVNSVNGEMKGVVEDIDNLEGYKSSATGSIKTGKAKFEEMAEIADKILENMESMSPSESDKQLAKLEKILSKNGWNLNEFEKKYFFNTVDKLGSLKSKEAADETILEMLMGKSARDISVRMRNSMDDQTRNLALQVWMKLNEILTLKGDQKAAFNRLYQSIDAGKNYSESMHRNNIFKAADLLGIKLPSGIF